MASAATTARLERLWTPPPPVDMVDRLAPLAPSEARLLWAVWCVPPRYRLSAARWRQEARFATEAALRAKVRRLAAVSLLHWREVPGRGLVFDGQGWQPRAAGRATFWQLALTAEGEARVRQALRGRDRSRAMAVLWASGGGTLRLPARARAQAKANAMS